MGYRSFLVACRCSFFGYRSSYILDHWLILATEPPGVARWLSSNPLLSLNVNPAMTIEFIEGFEGFRNDSNANLRTDLSRAWTTDSLSSIETATGSDGSGRAIKLNTAGGLMFEFDSGQTEVIVGFAWRWVTFPNVSVNIMSVTSPDISPTPYFRRDVRLRLVGTGGTAIDYQVIRGAGAGTSLGTAGLSLNVNTWYYVEIRILKDTDGTDGEVTVRHKAMSDTGEPSAVITLTGQDTTESEGNDYDSVRIEHDGSFRDIDIDNLYIDLGTGFTDSSFSGEQLIKLVRPDGAGVDADFTPSAGSNFENVDEADVDDDTTHNETSSAADRDLFTYDNPSDGLPVSAVQVTSIAREVTSSVPTHSVVRSGAGTEVDGANWGLGASYAGYHQCEATEPGGAAWTDSKISDAQFGYES